MKKLTQLELVAGVSLTGIIPFWNKRSKYYVPNINKILVSFYQIYKSKSLSLAVLLRRFRKELKLPQTVEIYLDNGAFSFIKQNTFPPEKEYVKYVRRLNPSWYPVPADFIPHPKEDKETQYEKFLKTMEFNRKYIDEGFVPVVHAGLFFERFLEEIKKLNPNPQHLAIGGLVPHMLLSKNGSREVVINTLKVIRKEFPKTKIHIFGIGGITSIYLLKLARVDTFDSIGWRVRAAWGIIQIPTVGERQIVPKPEGQGWSIPYPTEEEREILKRCQCPVCRKGKAHLLSEKSSEGFKARAVHNLYALQEELRIVNSFTKKEELLFYIDNHIKSRPIKKLVERLVKD